MFGQLSKMVKIGMLQKGKTVKFSRADLLDYSVNLFEVKRKLDKEKYSKVYDLYVKISKDNKKIEMNLDEYKKIIDKMVSEFVSIAPDELKK